MDISLLTSAIFNVILYIIVACLVYHLVIICDDENRPLPKEARVHYRMFMLFMVVVWPLLFLLIAMSQAEDARDKLKDQPGKQ